MSHCFRLSFSFLQFQAMLHCFKTSVFISLRLGTTASDLLSHSSVSGYVPLFQTFCHIPQFQAMSHCFKPFVAFVSFRLCLTVSKLLSHLSVSGFVSLFQKLLSLSSVTGYVHIEDLLQNVEVLEGERAKFVCKIKTHPLDEKRLKVQWKHNGEFLDLDLTRSESATGRHVYKAERNRHALIIKNTRLKDSGVYTCMASVGLDTDMSTAHLLVKGERSAHCMSVVFVSWSKVRAGSVHLLVKCERSVHHMSKVRYMFIWSKVRSRSVHLLVKGGRSVHRMLQVIYLFISWSKARARSVHLPVKGEKYVHRMSKMRHLFISWSKVRARSVHFQMKG